MRTIVAIALAGSLTVGPALAQDDAPRRQMESLLRQQQQENMTPRTGGQMQQGHVQYGTEPGRMQQGMDQHGWGGQPDVMQHGTMQQGLGEQGLNQPGTMQQGVPPNAVTGQERALRQPGGMDQMQQRSTPGAAAMQGRQPMGMQGQAGMAEQPGMQGMQQRMSPGARQMQGGMGGQAMDIRRMNRGTVQALQQRLAQQGYQVTPSGELDTATLNAMAAYQARQGLPVTGVPDQQSMSTLMGQTAPGMQPQQGQVPMQQQQPQMQ
ncbi:peptidoglycan-binding domain-containing protein [Telmatospirillum sp. J64-1]|uniref:peptidoglycan-binding domain-containing protein n=1 Tax=Telmatospirillum sp. J64-1 TaxID=2502183 RepID=UPI00115D07C6|nr:peptidoglycan-binding domain-containing protein [Telmatospirillum sp. J64-1]